jgi:hypothetical protein
MKSNQSLTAAITAAALVIGAGFAYAQTPSTAPGNNGEAQTQGNSTGQPSPATGTVMQNQPSSSVTTGSGATLDSGTTLNNSGSTLQSDISSPAPRADRN